MRILIVHPGPHFSVADVYRGWARGLAANGAQVAEFNLQDRLTFYASAKIERDGELRTAFDQEAGLRLAAQGIKASCYEWWPDLVFIVSGFFVPPDIYEIMRDRGHRIVLLHTESPYQDDEQIAKAPYADINLVNDPVNLDRFRDVAPTWYMPHAYDPAVHHPRRPDADCVSDFAFVGTGYESRIRFFEQVDWSGLDVALAGNWAGLTDDSPLARFLVHAKDECCPNDETVRLYTSSKMSANLYRREASEGSHAEGWAVSPREVELAACGVFYAREPRGEGDTLLPMLPTFTTPAELGNLARWWTSHDDERATAAEKAREAVADMTFENHAAELLRLVDKIPARRAG